MTHHQITKRIPKFRPYLSLEELDMLLSLCTDSLCATPSPNLAKILLIKSSARALMKTKISVEAGIQGAAYVATPVATLNEKLGFTGPIATVPAKDIPPPDFDALMNSLNSLSPADSSNPSTDTSADTK